MEYSIGLFLVVDGQLLFSDGEPVTTVERVNGKLELKPVYSNTPTIDGKPPVDGASYSVERINGQLVLKPVFIPIPTNINRNLKTPRVVYTEEQASQLVLDYAGMAPLDALGYDESLATILAINEERQPFQR